MRNLFSRYSLLNAFLLLGILISIIDHKSVWTYISVGILLPFLDSLDTTFARYFKIEQPSKIIWIIFMIILFIEAGIYYF